MWDDIAVCLVYWFSGLDFGFAVLGFSFGVALWFCFCLVLCLVLLIVANFDYCTFRDLRVQTLVFSYNFATAVLRFVLVAANLVFLGFGFPGFWTSCLDLLGWVSWFWVPDFWISLDFGFSGFCFPWVWFPWVCYF